MDFAHQKILPMQQTLFCLRKTDLYIKYLTMQNLSYGRKTQFVFLFHKNKLWVRKWAFKGLKVFLLLGLEKFWGWDYFVLRWAERIVNLSPVTFSLNWNWHIKYTIFPPRTYPVFGNTTKMEAKKWVKMNQKNKKVPQ